jgi:hypothetical protein
VRKACGPRRRYNHRQPRPAAQCVVHERRRLAVGLEALEDTRKRPEQRLAFEPRQQLTDAHMNAAAKANVARRRAIDVIAVRLGPLARIAVGGAKQHQHLLALGDCRAADLDVSRRGAEERLHRSFKSHRLLERSASLPRIGAQRRELIRIERELPHRRPDAVNGGVEARAEQRPDQ